MEIVRRRLENGHLGEVIGTYVSEVWIVCLDGNTMGEPCSSEAVALANKAYYEKEGHTVEIVHHPEKFSSV